MFDQKETQVEVLFTASVIVCVLRYLAVLLPDLPFFALLRSLEQPPQQYCLDFAIIIIFIVCSCAMLSRRTEKGRMLYWTEGISFAALVPAWRYIVDLFEWLETGDLSEINIIVKNAWGICKVLLISLGVFLFVGFVIVLLRHNDKIKKFLHSCAASIKKDVFLAQFICIMVLIHIVRLGVLFFSGSSSDRYPQFFSEIGGMDFVLTAAFFIALLVILFHSRKREEAVTPAVWFGMVLCLFGMVPARNHPAKMAAWFFVITALVVTAVMLVWGYRYLRSGKMKETKLWKNFDGDGITELAGKHIYDLTGNFINAVFAPFRFLLSYIDMLSAALLEDDSDDDGSHRKEKKYKNIRAKRKQERKKLAEESLVRIKPQRKRIGGKQA